MEEKFCSNYAKLSEATGVSVYELKSIHRLTRGHDDCPFIGRSGSYPSMIHKWKREHVDFIPSRQWPRSSEKLT